MGRLRLGILCISCLYAFVCLAGPKEDALQKRQEGDRLLAQGDLKSALAAYDEALALHSDPSFELARAQTLLKMRRFSEAKAAYERFLTQGKPKKKQQQEIQKALQELEVILQTSVRCDSDPQGATVYLNSRVDEPLGTTPLDANVPPGTYRLIFEKEGFKTTVESVVIQPSSRVEVKASMPLAPAVVSVVTKPQGAKIVLDGAEVGVSPMKLELTPGEHQLETQSAQHPTQKKKLSVTSGQSLTWEVDLENPPPASVTLSVTPVEASVLIDGKAASAGTLSLRPGTHTISASAPGYLTKEETLTLESEQLASLSLTLSPEPGVLRVKTNQPTYTLTLDGSPVEPASAIPILPGKHSLEVMSPGFATWSTEFEVAPTERLFADVSLQKAMSLQTKALLGGAALGAGTALVFGAIGIQQFVELRNRAPQTILPSEIQRQHTMLLVSDVGTLIALGSGFWAWTRAKAEGKSTGSITPEEKP